MCVYVCVCVRIKTYTTNYNAHTHTLLMEDSPCGVVECPVGEVGESGAAGIDSEK